jgi:hypothetical protein
MFYSIVGTISFVLAFINFRDGEYGWGVAMIMCAVIQYGAALEKRR